MLYNALSMGMKNYPSPRDFVTLSEEDRATTVGNTHKKLGKDRTCGSGDILVDRQTDKHTDVLITILCNRSRGRSSKSTRQHHH